MAIEVRRCLLIFFATVLVASCAETEESKSPTRLLIVTGRPFRVFHPLGEALAAIYTAEMPQVVPSVQSTTGSVSNVRALQDGEAELGFAQSDVTYDAFHHGTADDPKGYQNLRAIAALYVSAIHIVVPRDGPIRNLSNLQGKRLAVGPATGGALMASNIILDAQGIRDRVVRETVDLENEASRLRAGELDAGVIVASYPVAAVTQLNSSVGIRLLEIDLDMAAAIRLRYPFFRPVVIPDGVYQDQGGSVRTVGVDNLLICRADLPDELVYTLTRKFIESLGKLARLQPAAAAIDPEHASSTAIPLHPGAALYYRERELFR